MSSPWKQKQPEVVVDLVLKRAEVGKLARTLKARLSLAQLKVNRGWEDLALDTIEPRIEEELRLKRPMSSGDVLSDSSSSTGSEQYPRARHLMSSPLKEAAIFSDHIGSGSSNGHRKRNYHTSFDDRNSSSGSNKRYRSSPAAARLNHPSRASSFHQLTQSSPIKPRKTHFTTSSGPGLSFYGIPELHATNYAATSDDEDNTLPTHSFNITSSPPRTPPARSRGALNRRKQDKSGKSEEGADLLLYLATSPSPANPTSRVRMQPPSTPPPKNLALPSSMMTTPGGTGAFVSGFPNTPSQNFDFSDFVNITPSPAQGAWNRTPGAVKTPATVTRRRLTFENFIPQFPTSPNPNGKQTGLGMQLGGNLIS